MYRSWKKRMEVKHGPMRPLWQLTILLPLMPFYKIAQGTIWLVEYLDERLK